MTAMAAWGRARARDLFKEGRHLPTSPARDARGRSPDPASSPDRPRAGEVGRGRPSFKRSPAATSAGSTSADSLDRYATAASASEPAYAARVPRSTQIALPTTPTVAIRSVLAEYQEAASR